MPLWRRSRFEGLSDLRCATDGALKCAATKSNPPAQTAGGRYECRFNGKVKGAQLKLGATNSRSKETSTTPILQRRDARHRFKTVNSPASAGHLVTVSALSRICARVILRSTLPAHPPTKDLARPQIRSPSTEGHARDRRGEFPKLALCLHALRRRVRTRRRGPPGRRVHRGRAP